MNKKNMLLFSLLCAASFDISSATKPNNETGNYSIGNVKKNLDKYGLETAEQYRIRKESFNKNQEAIAERFDAKISTKHKIHRDAKS